MPIGPPGLAARLAAAAALVLGACATQSPERAPAPALRTVGAFEVSGRFSAKREQEGVAGQFSWLHAGPADTLVFSTPTGQALARMRGDADGVVLELSDGRVEHAPGWERLTERVLGVPIPVRGLAWWVRALPHPGSAHTEEADREGRVSVLRQDGWEIVYGYGDVPEPARLRMTYPGIDVRLAIDQRDAAR